MNESAIAERVAMRTAVNIRDLPDAPWHAKEKQEVRNLMDGFIEAESALRRITNLWTTLWRQADVDHPMKVEMKLLARSLYGEAESMLGLIERHKRDWEQYMRSTAS